MVEKLATWCHEDLLRRLAKEGLKTAELATRCHVEYEQQLRRELGFRLQEHAMWWQDAAVAG